MASNVQITPGTGDVVAAEDISSVKYQKVKLFDSTAASTTGTGIAANPLQVSLANTAANATAVKTDGSAVTQPVSISGNQAVNITQVAGSSISQGHGTAATAIRVELPTDGTGVVNAAQSGTWSNTVTQGTATNLKTQSETYQGGSAVASGNPLEVNIRSSTAITPGTAAANLGKAEDAAHSSGDTGVMSLGVRKDTATALAGADGDYQPAIFDANGRQHVIDPSTSTIATNTATSSTDFWPIYNSRALGGVPPATDPAGALVTRGAIVTDEGASRANFTGSSIASSIGTATFTNGSATVTGTGFSTLDLHWPEFVKLNADAESAWGQILFVNSDTTLTLAATYSGTGGTGASSSAQLAPVTGSGGTISVASGQLTIATGTTNASQSYVYKWSGANSAQLQSSFSISQRVANQNIYFGAEASTSTTIKQYARFNFNGTDNTKVVCEVGYNPTTTPSANEVESATITLPNGVTTASAQTYKVELQFDQVTFSVNGIVVQTFTKRIPHVMTIGNNSYQVVLRTLNGTGASTTSVVCDYIHVKNFNRIDSFQTTVGDSSNAQVVSQKSATTGSNTLQSAVSATGNGTALNTDGMSTATFTITGTFSATVTFEGTEDGTNYSSIPARAYSGGTASTTTTTTGTYVASVSGLSSVRARVTWTSGTSITVTAHATPLNFVAPALSTGSATSTVGSAVPASASYEGGNAITSLPAAATAGNLTGASMDKYGRRVVVTNTVRDLRDSNAITITSSTSPATLISGIASTKTDIENIVFANSSATATLATLSDGTKSFYFYIPAGNTIGISNTLYQATTANTAWTVTCGTSVASLYVSTNYIKNA